MSQHEVMLMLGDLMSTPSHVIVCVKNKHCNRTIVYKNNFIWGPFASSLSLSLWLQPRYFIYIQFSNLFYYNLQINSICILFFRGPNGTDKSIWDFNSICIEINVLLLKYGVKTIFSEPKWVNLIIWNIIKVNSLRLGCLQLLIFKFFLTLYLNYI